MRAAVLSIGAELLRGDIVDTNAPHLARELSQLGFEVRRMSQSGDLLEDLTAEILRSLEVADVVLCTGGLGPTADDLTRHAIAAAVGEEVTIDESVVREVAERFHMMRRTMPERNRQQAEVIPSATVIRNPNGTAPGWFVNKDGKVIAAMPGLPKEMVPMWRDSIQPLLEVLLPGHRELRSLMTFGIGESTVERMLDDLIAWRPDVTVATYAKEAGVQVHITAEAGDPAEARDLAGQAERTARDILGHAVFGSGNDTLSSALGHLLRERKMTVATLESCTSGEVASALTDTAGSSDYYLGSVVAYTERVKAEAGVDPQVMAQHGLISAETACAMARAARSHFSASAGIGTTGVAGSEPVEGKPAGTCYVAVSAGDVLEVRELHRPGSREMSKRYFSQCALDLLRRVLIGTRTE